MDQIQEILSNINIVDIIGQHVKLVKKGKNYVGLCPFHSEKTPSFNVSADKGVYYCFGCHASGNVLTFLQEYEKLSFKEALQILADKAGIKLKKIDYKSNKDNNIIEILQHMKDIFVEDLYRSEEALNYLNKRNFKKETIEEFSIGYAANSWNYMYFKLLKKGYSHQDLLNAGVIKKSDKNENEYYDRFRHRIIIPIFNVTNIVVGFSGRAIDPNDEPKYLNSTENSIFKKSQLLFNLNKAKEYIKKQNEVIVMEGHLDVIKAYQAGTKNVVASMGTAFGEAHAAILKRYCDNIVFCFDNDNAGINATYKNIEYAQKYDMNIKIIKIEKYKDPDECIDNDIEYWYKLVEEKKDLMDYIFETIELMYNKNNPHEKSKLIDTILPIVYNYKNIVVQDYYLRQVSQRYNVSLDILKEKMDNIYLDFLSVDNNKKIIYNIPKDSRFYLLALIIHYIDKWDEIEKKPNIDVFENTVLESIYNSILEGERNYFSLENKLENEEDKLILRNILFEISKLDIKYSVENLYNEIISLLKKIKFEDKKKKLNEISQKMKQISDKTSDEYKNLLIQYNEILKS